MGVALGDILVCAVCHGRLDGTTCAGCGRTYARAGEVMDMSPAPPPDEEVARGMALWHELQANGERAYVADPPSSLSVGDRADARAFAAFARLEGRVLDVGCGPQALPSYAHAIAGDLVGIDPLLGEQPRDFAFVQGMAEYLPFGDATFDRVLFATSLDHVLAPSLALAEARRVTKPGGAVVVWLGEPEAPPAALDLVRAAARMARRGELGALARGARAALRRRMVASADRTLTIQTAGATMTFDVPDGAVDAFHVAHPSAETVTAWLREAGLTIEATERPVPSSCFIRARRPG